MNSLYNKRLEEIKLEDINSLIDSESYEDKQLDFKESLPGESVRSKKNFLKDVTAFANTIGGDIIYGIKEEKGKPKETIGIENYSFDKFKLRLESIIRDGVEPQIPRYDFTEIEISQNKKIFILRIFQSISIPHYITLKLKDNERFFLRTSSGNSPMSYQEIKNSFLHAGNVLENIKKFRNDRINNVLNKETSVILENNSHLCLHLIPLSDYYQSHLLSFNDINKNSSNLIKFETLKQTYRNERYCLDGYMRYGGAAFDNRAKRYILFSRNGFIEYITSDFFHKNKYFGSKIYESELINLFPFFFNYYKSLSLNIPILIFLSLVNVRDFVLDININSYWNDILESHPLDRDIIYYPELLLEDYSIEIDKFLRPLFDSVWNSFGYPMSINYDNDGNWIDSNN